MMRLFSMCFLFLTFANSNSVFAVKSVAREYREACKTFNKLFDEKSIVEMSYSTTVVSSKNLYKVNGFGDITPLCGKFIDQNVANLNRSNSVVELDNLVIHKYSARKKRRCVNVTQFKLYLFEVPSSERNFSAQYYVLFPYDSWNAFHDEATSHVNDVDRSLEIGGSDEEKVNEEEENEDIPEQECPPPMASMLAQYQLVASAVDTNALLPMQTQNTGPQTFASSWQDYFAYPPIPAGNQTAYQNCDAVNSYMQEENSAAFSQILTVNCAPPLSLPNPQFLSDIVSSFEIEHEIPSTNSHLNQAPHVLNVVEQDKSLSPELTQLVKTFFSWLTTQIELRGYSSTGEIYEVKAFGADHEEAWAVVTLKITEDQHPETLAVKFFQEPKLPGPIDLRGMECINVDDSYPLFIKQGVLLFSRESISIEELKCRYLRGTDFLFTKNCGKKFSIYVVIPQKRRLIEIHGDTPKFGRQFNIYISSCRVNGKEVELYQ